jgi:cytochrome c-type biogenesis protein CcmH
VILSFLLALLAFLTLLLILAPLLRGARPVPARASFDQAVYRDQLQELDREIARGVLTETEANAARLEIQRRLLAADQLPAVPSRLTRSPVLAAVIFLVAGFGSVGFYLWLGAPGIPDAPYASRPAEAAGDSEDSTLQQATDKLAEKLKQTPSDPQGWLLYARSRAMLNQWDKAEAAYRHVMELGDRSPEVIAGHAEMLVLAAGGTVSPAAEAAFKQILQTDPGNGMARFYLAMAAAQAGQPLKAIEGWQALLADIPSDSPARAAVGQQIAAAAKTAGIPVPELAMGTAPAAAEAAGAGPDSKAMADAAALPDDQRQAMIRDMVEGLAAKQQVDPGNLDGWLRLGRAYAVLHEADKAADAYDKAAALKPDDVSIPMQAVRALMSDIKPPAKIPPRVIGLLKRIEATNPQEPMVLWYLGIMAAQESRFDEARRYWKTLLTKLPADDEDAKMIQAALDGLAAR